MAGMEIAGNLVRSAAAVPIAHSAHASGPAAWAGRRMGEFVLDEGTESTRTIDALVSRDVADFQYVSDLPTEAIEVARLRSIEHLQAHITLEDARTGAWHVTGLVDPTGTPIRFDELGALRQPFQSAKFSTNHADAGSVHGEAHEFALRADAEDAIDQLILNPPPTDLMPVDTASASIALAAAGRPGASLAAPMSAQRLPSHAIEPIASFEPVDAIPGILRSENLLPTFRHSSPKVAADLDAIRSATGAVDDVRKLARRMSMERGGQQIMGYEMGADRYLLVPMITSNPVDGVRPLRMLVGLRSALAEAAFVTGPAGGPDSGIAKLNSMGHQALDPSYMARRIRGLTQAVDQPVQTADPLRADLAAREARITEINAELSGARWSERGTLKRERASIEQELPRLRREADAATSHDVRERASNQRQLKLLTEFVEQHHLPEREEWLARFGFDDDGAAKLRDLASAEPGDTFADVVNAARRAAFESADEGTVVLQALDGTLWTARTPLTADGVTRMGTGPYGNRPLASLRAVTSGGRTVQWDDNGIATLS